MFSRHSRIDPAYNADMAHETIAVPEVPAGPHKRLTHDDLRIILRLRDKGLSQAAIAERLAVSTSTVTRALGIFGADSRPLARAYLEGKALKMARSIVRKGKPTDHLRALQGLNVIDADQSSGVTIQIGSPSDTLPALPDIVVSQSETDAG